MNTQITKPCQHILITICFGLLLILLNLFSCSKTRYEDEFGKVPTMQEVIQQTLKPYQGEFQPGVNTKTLFGKVMCGYQGWFTASGDGSGRKWFHWGWTSDKYNGRTAETFGPGDLTVDMWPDISELDKDELYPTDFKYNDGSIAYVFSSYNKKTVIRHIQWMKEYEIDGAFVQRFFTETCDPIKLRHTNTVLSSVREGCHLHGRTYAVMYDLSGMGKDKINEVKADWKTLIDYAQITTDSAYLHHSGKPVVAVWGLGFSDNRQYTIDDGFKLVDFFKNDPVYGNLTVMLGIPTFWYDLNRDCVSDTNFHDLLRKADIISPWTVTRYTTPEEYSSYVQNQVKKDIEWCRENKLDYLPVVFPGFSWHNMVNDSPVNMIPRLKGEFLWSQYAGIIETGTTMIYQAMFDEVDEATAIFKVTNNPPMGEFATYEGLPSDFYLRLVGLGGKMLRKEIEYSQNLPELLRELDNKI